MLNPSCAGKDDNVLKYINKQKKVFSIPMESGVSEFGLHLEWICSGRYQNSPGETDFPWLGWMYCSLDRTDWMVEPRVVLSEI